MKKKACFRKKQSGDNLTKTEVGQSVRELGVGSAYQTERKRKLASKFTQAYKKQLKGNFYLCCFMLSRICMRRGNAKRKLQRSCFESGLRRGCEPRVQREKKKKDWRTGTVTSCKELLLSGSCWNW